MDQIEVVLFIAALPWGWALGTAGILLYEWWKDRKVRASWRAYRRQPNRLSGKGWVTGSAEMHDTAVVRGKARVYPKT